MVLYNVTIKVEHDAVDEWLSWMKEEHMPELLKTGCFKDCKLFRLREIDEHDGITFSAQYYCSSMDDYNRYINDFAASMRGKGIDKFKDKFVAFRTVMEKA